MIPWLIVNKEFMPKGLGFKNMNRRTAAGTAEYRREKNCLFLSKTSAVRNSLFDIVLRTPPCGRVPSFDIQNTKQAHIRSKRDSKFGTVEPQAEPTIYDQAHRRCCYAGKDVVFKMGVLAGSR